jgi:phosphatidylglycerophosphatase A
VKVENAPLAINLAKLFMSTLVTTMETEFDSDIVIVELETLKSVLEELGLCFLNEEEIKEFSEKMLKLLKNSDEKKVLNKQTLSEDLDEEEKEMVDDEIKREEEVQVAISELIGALFKTHKNMTLGLANYLIYNILPAVFIENQTENMLKFGIFLIDDIVEFLGY